MATNQFGPAPDGTTAVQPGIYPLPNAEFPNIKAAWSTINQGTALTLTNNNLTVTAAFNDVGTTSVILANLGLNTGRWYFEVTLNVPDPSTGTGYGIVNGTQPLNTYLGINAGGWCMFANYGFAFSNNTPGTAVTVTDTAGDVFQFAVDLSAGNLWFGINGTWQNSGDPASGTNPIYTGVTGTLYPSVCVTGNTPRPSLTLNVGASSFKYTPPFTFLPWGQGYTILPFSTFNPNTVGGHTTLRDNQLIFSNGGSYAQQTQGLTLNSNNSGQWYYEMELLTPDSVNNAAMGIATGLSPNAMLGVDLNSWCLRNGYGFAFHNNTNGTAVTPSNNDGDIFMTAVNIDTGKLWFGINGTWQNSGNPATGANPIYTGVTGNLFPAVSVGVSSGQTTRSSIGLNVGATPFRFTPPSGFLAWG